MDTNNGTELLSKALKYSYPATAPKMKITLTISSTVAWPYQGFSLGNFLAQANTFLTETTYM